MLDLGSVLVGGATIGAAGITLNAGALAIPAAPLLLAKALIAGKSKELF